MTNRSTGIDAALACVKVAIADVPMDGFEAPDLADAFLALSLEVAGQIADPRTIARVHMGIAERYFGQAESKEPRGTPAAGPDSHAILSAAVNAMRQRGHDDYLIRHQMLAFAIAWVRQEEGTGGAETIYRHADALATRGPSTH